MSGNNIVVSSGGGSSSSSSSGNFLTLAQANAIFISRASLTSSLASYTGAISITSAGSLTTAGPFVNTGLTTIRVPNGNSTALTVTDAANTFTYVRANSSTQQLFLGASEIVMGNGGSGTTNNYSGWLRVQLLELGFNTSTGGSLSIRSASAAATTLNPHPSSVDTTYTLPPRDAVTPNFPLISDGAGNLTFAWPGQVVTGTISSAEIKALNTTYKLLVAAPGAGKTIFVETFYMHYKYDGVNPYTGGGNVALNYTNSGTHWAGSGSVLAGNFTNTSDSWTGLTGEFGNGSGITFTNPINQGLYVYALTANFGGSGTGTINYILRYRIEDINSIWSSF